jgi:uncharacterized protein involved in exopolysaccharide biosynthesis/Mrp family chromosome partitioning ATPase
MSPKPSLPDASAGRTPDGLDVRNVVAILARRKWWVIGVPALLSALTIVYLLIAHPAYTATAQVYVDPRDQHTPKDDPLQNTVPGDGLLLVESQLKIITSNEVLNRAIEQTRLQSDPEFNGERFSLGAFVKSLIGLAKPEDRALTTLRNLRKNVVTKRLDRSFVIDILASADTAARAAVLANAVATAYLEEQAGANSSYNKRLSDSITSQLGKLRDEVSRGEQAVAAYKTTHNLIGGRSRTVNEQQLDEANTQLTNAKTRLAEAQARLRMVEAVERGNAGLDALPEAVQSGAIAQLRAKAADASREEAQLAQIDGPNHPALLAARAQVRDAQAAIQTELKTIARAVRNAEASERANVQNLQANFDALRTQSETNEKALVPLRELERKAESSRIVYESFLGKAKTASEQQGIDTTNIRLISRATLPEHKSWPPTLIMLAAALFAGLTIGVALALAVDRVEEGDEGPEAGSTDAEPPLAPSLEPAPVPSPGPLPSPVPAPASAAAPAAAFGSGARQLLRLSAELLAAPKGHTVVLVPVESDARLDLVALQLARAVIASRMDVLVVDADLARHGVSTTLGFTDSAGLREVMAGTAQLAQVARLHRPTAMHVVPAGRAPLGSGAPAARQALEAAFKQFREFDRVVVNGGEMGATAAEYGMYAMADEVVFLAASPGGKTDDAAVLVELLRHRRIKARIVMVEPELSVAA